MRSTGDTHRAVKHHDLPQHLGHVGQRVRRQAEAAGVHQLGDELLPVLLHGLTNQLLPHLKVLLVLQGHAEVRATGNRKLLSQPRPNGGSNQSPGALAARRFTECLLLF